MPNDPKMSDEEILARAVEMFSAFNTESLRAFESREDITRYPNTLTGNHVAARIAALVIARKILLEGDDDSTGLISDAANIVIDFLSHLEQPTN